MDADLLIEIVGAVIGLTYLYFEYHANRWMWNVGLLMNFFYIYIFYTSGFYADMAIYTYYLGTNIYGRISWGKNNKKTGKKALPITHLKRQELYILIACWLVVNVFIYFVLEKFTDSTIPLGDSFTTALSIVGMWMIAKKRIEHWWLWFIVNLTSTCLYLWKGLYPTAALFVVYTVVSVMGYYKWLRMMKQETAISKN